MGRQGCGWGGGEGQENVGEGQTRSKKHPSGRNLTWSECSLNFLERDRSKGIFNNTKENTKIINWLEEKREGEIY